MFFFSHLCICVAGAASPEPVWVGCFLVFLSLCLCLVFHRLRRQQGNAQSTKPSSQHLEGFPFLQHYCSVMGTFLLLPTVSQPAGAHISSGSKGKLCTESIVTVLQARAETGGILWSCIGFVKRSPDGGVGVGVQGSHGGHRLLLLPQKAVAMQQTASQQLFSFWHFLK